MDVERPSGEPGINGDSDVLAVERAINELRRGRAVAVTNGDESELALSVEAASAQAIEGFAKMAGAEATSRGDGPLTLAVSARRAHALSLVSEASNAAVGVQPIGSNDNNQVNGRTKGLAVVLRLPANISPDAVRKLAGIDDASALTAFGTSVETAAGTSVGAAAIAPVVGSAFAADTLQRVATTTALDAAVELSRYARLLPSVIALQVVPEQLDTSVLRIDAAQIERFRASRGTGLERIVSARVPLRDEENCTLVLFRDTGADVEHLAIVVGNVSAAKPVPVRVHSACLTGDVLGSLRCDCGDQLRGAMRSMSERGGGVLLYLEQEGRGIGLANKLRAYSLQDAGLDTYDADGHLGFDDDDRSFTEAATMLRSLGVLRIHLMTNNPHKVDALAREGIEVLDREPLTGQRNPHNERYLAAKASRAGHHLHNEKA